MPASAEPLSVTGIDHLVLRVPDVAPVAAWYRDELGLVFDGLDEVLAGTRLFATLRVDATTIIDLLPGERTGENVDHVAFVVDADVDALAGSGRFDVVSGPADLSGARGQGRGVYVRDPRRQPGGAPLLPPR